MSEALPIFYEARTVGRIESSTDGPGFVYDPAWINTRGAFPLSVLMPLSRPRVPPALFATWAMNLLPEGMQLSAVGLKLGESPDDVVAILAEIGRDTAGALSIGRPGTASAGGWRPIGGDDALERIIEELPAKPFLAGEDGVSMSLAGVQSKLGVAIDSAGRLCIPLEGAPSTHILKPDSDRLFGSVQNEAFCLVLARRIGLEAPPVTTGRAGARSYFLIERYDRMRQGDRWRRLHQEDFCQALGKPPSAKYEGSRTGLKGPTLTDMFALTRRAMRAPDVLALLDHVIFNVIACNTDAHAKNYSLMISGRGFSLAPIYDVMCASAWVNVTQNLAQKIAGKNRGEHLKRRHWETFAKDCGLNADRLVERVRVLTGLALSHTEAALEAVARMPAGPHPLLPAFRSAVDARARALILGLDEGLAAKGPPEPSSTAPKPPSATPKRAPKADKTPRRRKPG